MNANENRLILRYSQASWEDTMEYWNAPARLIGAAAGFTAILTLPLVAQRQQAPAAASHTQIVLLGTGNPPADPDRAGPATAIVVNGTPYLVDFGAGVIRRAAAAVVDKGITALAPTNLR